MKNIKINIIILLVCAYIREILATIHTDNKVAEDENIVAATIDDDYYDEVEVNDVEVENDVDRPAFASHANAELSASVQGLNLAMVCTMDGTLHGINAAFGTRWKTNLGEPTIQSYQRSDTTSAGVIVPGEDGSLYIVAPQSESSNKKINEIQRFHHSIPHIVSMSPVHQLPIDGEEKNDMGMFILGSKSTKLFQIDTYDGEILSSFTADSSGKPPEVLDYHEGSGKPVATVARHDYRVRAFDPETKEELWNITYSKFTLPSSSLLAAEQASGFIGDVPMNTFGYFPEQNAIAKAGWQWEGSHVVAAFGSDTEPCEDPINDPFCQQITTLIPQVPKNALPPPNNVVYIKEIGGKDGHPQLLATANKETIEVQNNKKLPLPEKKKVDEDLSCPDENTFLSISDVCLAGQPYVVKGVKEVPDPVLLNEKPQDKVSKTNIVLYALFGVMSGLLLLVMFLYGQSFSDTKHQKPLPRIPQEQENTDSILKQEERNSETSAPEPEKEVQLPLDEVNTNEDGFNEVIVRKKTNTHVIGDLELFMDKIKGHGCQGTTVFVGRFGKRPVAVKRMLKSFFGSAKKEIDLLICLDGHPNIVRYFAKQECRDFIYIALELCSTTLDLALQEYIRRSQRARKKLKLEDKQSFHCSTRFDSNVDFVEAIINAIAHLHRSRIVHLDIKPQNILVIPRDPLRGVGTYPRDQIDQTEIDPKNDVYFDKTPKEILANGIGDIWQPKISDMGLGKRIGEGTSSFHFNPDSLAQMQQKGGINTGSSLSSSIVGVGTVGWRAPELLGVQTEDGTQSEVEEDPDEERLRLSRKIDIFSLGCILHYVFTDGSHPFGDVLYEREQRIVCNNPVGLAQLKHIPEAKSLISKMVAIKPSERPSIDVVLQHPALWRASKKLQFLMDLSDRLENEIPNNSSLLDYFEARSTAIIGKSGWFVRIHPLLQADVLENKFRKYNFSSLRDLLRVIRNKRSHYRDLDEGVQNILSPIPYGFLEQFTSLERFPKLIHICYECVLKTLAHEADFAHYLGQSAIKLYAEASRKWAEEAKNIEYAGSWWMPEVKWIHHEANKNANKNKKGVTTNFNHKTSLCQHYEANNGTHCPIGKRCAFAHGYLELRVLPKLDSKSNQRSPHRPNGSSTDHGWRSPKQGNNSFSNRRNNTNFGSRSPTRQNMRSSSANQKKNDLPTNSRWKEL